MITDPAMTIVATAAIRMTVNSRLPNPVLGEAMGAPPPTIGDTNNTTSGEVTVPENKPVDH